MKKRNEHSDIATFLIGASLAAIVIICGILLKRVLWPIVKWLAKKAWARITRKSAKPAPQAKQVENTSKPSNGLPIPDVFKDCDNLAPLREFKW